MEYEYDYIFAERVIMALINSMSNVFTIPSMFILKKDGKIYEYYFAIFSFIVSFMYHFCEGLDIVIFLPQSKWHELDNVASIFCFNQLILSLTKFYYDLKYIRKANYLFLFLTLLFQQRGPWEIQNTLIPLFIYLFISFYQMCKYGLPNYNKAAIIKGGLISTIALLFFYRGLDDLNDYLRIWHSFWHVFMGIASFYLLQIQAKECLSLKQVYIFVIDEYKLNQKRLSIIK